tara:strand:- start:3955 stop:5082 length:1128 start_codon:yes stop_codon:yes gene_type:complete
MNKNKNIIIAGGGTGGHLFPAFEIMRLLKNKNFNLIYIGSKYGIEAKQEIPYAEQTYLMNIKGIQRTISLKSIKENCIFPFKFLNTYIKIKKIIEKIKPVLIIGTGGYSSGIPLLVGTHLKIPTLIQEQNSIPGLVTKKLYKKVDCVCVAYTETKKILQSNNIVLTGNPINIENNSMNKKEARIDLELNKNKNTILIIGGSQGAAPLNEHFCNNYEFYKKNNYQIILQCGTNNYHSIPNHIKNQENILIKGFFNKNNMLKVYKAADIVVARAGAISISELTYLSKAMILIPYKYAADNHQEINAKSIENKKACIAIDQDKLKTGILESTINKLFNKNLINQLENNSFKASYPNATNSIYKQIKSIIANNHEIGSA